MKKLDSAVEDIKELKTFKEATIKEIHSIKTNFILNHKKKFRNKRRNLLLSKNSSKRENNNL